MKSSKSFLSSLGLLLTVGSLYSVNQHRVKTPTASSSRRGAPWPPIQNGQRHTLRDGRSHIATDSEGNGKLYVASRWDLPLFLMLEEDLVESSCKPV
jgi:hypothetical protein